jgi:FtsH-binding integral membrane protein
MRGYLIPLVGGIALVACAFMPWVHVGSVALAGFPDVFALWIIGLGALAAVLATLSMITRKNSRHPLLVVGLISLGIMFLSWRIMPRTAGDRALTVSQAFAIVENLPMQSETNAFAGSGIYVGLVASAAIVCFGLTIVVKRVQRPYSVPDPDDDV